MKTITKFCFFVIFSSVASVCFLSCSFGSKQKLVKEFSSSFEEPAVIGTISSSEINESSGLSASRCQADVFWTHNDSGDDSYIYAINGKGKLLGIWRVPEIKNIDWEDIASFKDGSDACYLYIGEIGDNKAVRHEHSVFRVAEPRIARGGGNLKKETAISTGRADEIKFTYPDFDQDAETLLVHPISGTIYVVAKRLGGPAGVYEVAGDLWNSDAVPAKWITDVSVPAIPNGFITGGDISPDGRRIALCDYGAAYEFTLPGDSQRFDDVWGQEPETIKLGHREVGESICYGVDGSSVFATSEQKNSPLIKVSRKK